MRDECPDVVELARDVPRSGQRGQRSGVHGGDDQDGHDGDDEVLHVDRSGDVG